MGLLAPMWCVVAVCALSATEATAGRPVHCSVLPERIEAEVRQDHSESAWTEIGPHLGPAAVDTLLGRRDSPQRWSVHQALGLSKQAEALRALRVSGAVDLPAALALLALGDPTGTPTVSHALFEMDVETRRQTAKALSRLEQARPRIMLYQALRDADPLVRLSAAEVHAVRGSRRARRVLDDLLEDKRFGEAAARILYASGGRSSLDRVSRLAPSMRGRVVVREAVRSRRLSLNRLRRMARQKDPHIRAGALAALALRQVPTKRLAFWARGAPKGELTMALALSGEATAVDALAVLEPEEIPGAIEVIWAHSGAGQHRARLDRELARSIARSVSRWKPGVPPDLLVRMLEALKVAEPEAAVAWARVLLTVSPEAKVRQAAGQLLLRGGKYEDVGPLLQAADSTPNADARMSLLAAAARICGR